MRLLTYNIYKDDTLIDTTTSFAVAEEAKKKGYKVEVKLTHIKPKKPKKVNKNKKKVEK